MSIQCRSLWEYKKQKKQIVIEWLYKKIILVASSLS